MTVVEPRRSATGNEDRRQRLAAALEARRAAPALLAPNQERLYVLQQLDPTSTAYAEAVVLRLRGGLDLSALSNALGALPERHEWLRSRIANGPDGAVQVTDGPLRVSVRPVDLTTGAVSDAAGAGAAPPGRHELGAAATAWLGRLVGEPLSLEDGPLWRTGLAVLGPEDHLLALVVHHVACDATSLGVMVEELGDRYDAEVLGVPAGLQRTASPRDLAAAVRALQSSPAGLAAVGRHADALEVADLTARWERLDMQATTAAAAAPSSSRRVPPAVHRRLRRVATEHGLTTFAVLSAAVAAALADALEVASPVLGIPVDLRSHLPGSDEVVSFLVETVAVALPDIRDHSLLSAASVVRDTVTDALQQPPRFEEVVGELRRRGVLPASGDPVQAYVTWLDGEELTTLGEQGPAVSHVDLPLTEAKFDLAWTAVEHGRSLDLRLEHDAGRLDPSAADRLLDRVLAILDVATSAPQRPLGELELLGGDELAQLRAWEGMPGPVPEVDLLSQVLAGCAASSGPVLVGDHGSIDGTELVVRVDALAATLRAAGVGPGVRVAVSAARVPGMVVSLLAVLRAGGTFLPLDPAHPHRRQSELARSARVGAVVGVPGWVGDLAAALGVAAVPVDADGRPAHPAGPPTTWPARSPSDLAYVMFTSGSSGRPKAVRVTDAAVVARVDSYREVLAASGVCFLLQSTLTFDASIYLFWALATSGRLVLPTDQQATDPSSLADLAREHEVTDAFFVPSFYESLLQVAPPGALDSFRRMCVGGDVMAPAVAALHLDTVPQVALLNVYGPTETVVTATLARVGPTEIAHGSSVPIGRPHPGTVARLLDRFGRRVPLGAVGELHLGGPAVADGYDEHPGRASSSLEPFRVTAADETGGPVRWYATGDLARWREDGCLEYLGRRDRQVKLRGQRVELAEVEAALREVVGVVEAAVEVVGDGDRRRSVAFVIAPGVTVGTLHEGVAALLPSAWLPDVLLVERELPRNSSGKLDRAALRARASLPVHQGPVRTPANAPATMTQRSVLSVVQGLLGDPGVTLDDDFFVVGGNSLLAARLMGQLSTVLGVSVPLHEIAGNPTIRGIAACADAAADRLTPAAEETARLVPVRRAGSLAPVVLVARDGATSLVLLHVLSRIEPDRPVWTLLRAMPAAGLITPDLVDDSAGLVTMLTQQFPDGPVHVLGHSASGLVAVEVARRLGDRRGATVLLDTLPPSTWGGPARKMHELSRILVRGHRLRRALRGLAAGQALPAAEVRALRNWQDATAAYRMRLRPVGFGLHLLSSAETREATGREDLGWDRWAQDVQLRSLRGGHHELLLQPDVETTAALLSHLLTP